ncbi:cbb3-type cytochrome c oxidase subunit 3 [Bosea sp. LjRoot9]|uniref:cbb3-type cytochrome c oxidase subunit 3 n=1 Tax=Bosea sp. LjRoot9 TaxID=3342341 RepID=UPI003ECE40F4
MDTTYQWLANFAQSAGLLYFISIFVGVCGYAFWPKNRARFEQAAYTPLKED